jgi:ribose 5-phosphate isomerase A
VSEAIDRAKEAAGRSAAAYVVDGMRVGLGTGSTVHWTIVALGERRPDIICTATSAQTHDLATSLGLEVVEPDVAGHLDLTIDGADEVDHEFNLTKGGGGAHTREKLVARMSDRFIVVVDESKLVEHLGAFGTPLEVLDFAPGVVSAWVEALGSAPLTTRPGRSDNGHLLLDAHSPPIVDPDGLSASLAELPGLVEHGLFPASMVERVVVAGADGVRELVR